MWNLWESEVDGDSLGDVQESSIAAQRKRKPVQRLKQTLFKMF